MRSRITSTPWNATSSTTEKRSSCGRIHRNTHTHAAPPSEKHPDGIAVRNELRTAPRKLLPGVTAAELFTFVRRTVTIASSNSSRWRTSKRSEHTRTGAERKRGDLKHNLHPRVNKTAVNIVKVCIPSSQTHVYRRDRSEVKEGTQLINIFVGPALNSDNRSIVYCSSPKQKPIRVHVVVAPLLSYSTLRFAGCCAVGG